MRLSAALFALALGLGFPAIAVAVGLELANARLGALALLGFSLGVCIPTGLDLLTQLARADELSIIRQRDANTEATQVATAERWARLQAETPAPVPDYDRAWYLALETFLMAGDAGGFSIRKMSGVVGSDVWAQLTTMLAELGLLTNAPGRGYVWANDYTLARALRELRAGGIPLPDGPAPVVNIPINNTSQRSAERRPTTVIQGN